MEFRFGNGAILLPPVHYDYHNNYSFLSGKVEQAIRNKAFYGFLLLFD